MAKKTNLLDGRGSLINPKGAFQQQHLAVDYSEAVDVWEEIDSQTSFIEDHPVTIVNKVKSPDVGMQYSLNPYQGCEHGCAYCYARTSHEYWGYSAGKDFEQKIIIKKNAPILFERFLNKCSWDASTISLSGNTDCYQPIERRMELTRQILLIARKYKQPIGIITKNAGVLRDIDILADMAKLNLTVVYISLTTLSTELKNRLEPRTSGPRLRLEAIKRLSDVGVPVGVMTAPIIPGLNDHELPQLLEQASLFGATQAGYTLARLNGAIATIFQEWALRHYPDRAEKVIESIKQSHGGSVSDTKYKRRMKGEGRYAQLVKQLFMTYTGRYGLNCQRARLRQDLFRRPNSQLTMAF